MYELFQDYTEAVRSRPYRLYRWSVRNQARRVICISRTTASDAQRLWGVPESRVDLVYCGDGRLVRIFTRRSPSVVAVVLVAELAAWDAGSRDSQAMAAPFRTRFVPTTVCRRFMAGIHGEADARAVGPGGSSDD